MKRLFLENGEWTSIYIPYIDSSYSRDYLKTIFESKYKIGKIKQIDIVKTESKSHLDDFSLFIHFDYWYTNKFTLYLRKYFQSHQKYNMKNYKKYYPVTENIPDNFVMMKVVNNQISETSENEDRLFRLEKRIALLEDELNALRDLVLYPNRLI